MINTHLKTQSWILLTSLLLVLTVAITCATPPDSKTPIETNTRRGLYVDQFNKILTSPEQTKSLLEFSQAHGFDYLVLYNIHTVFSSSHHAKLSAFITQAKEKYDIKEIGIAGETVAFFDQVEIYNQKFPGKCDVINLEYEYWNNSDYPGFITRLKHMRTIADRHNLLVEAYIGWLNDEKLTSDAQSTAITKQVDRLLVHAYRNTPQSTFRYTRERLQALSKSPSKVDIWPIFSAEHPLDNIQQNNFMGNWFTKPTNTLTAAEKTYLKDFAKEPAPWTNDISLTGFQYFTYSVLKNRLESKNHP
ncbi:MAG: hypothetical protein ACSHX6_15740 [Akkermansiaceae bacterium]